MPNVTVESENACQRGWLFSVLVERPSGATRHTVRLDWLDYEHWCHGSVAPERVARAIVEYLLEHRQSRRDPDLDAGPVPDTFDASTARRWHPEIDREIAWRL